MTIQTKRHKTKMKWLSPITCLLLFSCGSQSAPSNAIDFASAWTAPSCYVFTDDVDLEDRETDPSRHLAYVSSVERMKLLHAYPPEKIELDYQALFNHYQAIDATSYILEQAKFVDLLMLNEAHHYPTHRRFARTLLKGLWDANYRYFGVETLTYVDDFKQLTYPTADLGQYSQEPTFALLLREAIDLGFLLFPYETTGPESGKIREQEQAQHIAEFLADHKAGKTFIYCGYSHNFECELPEWEKAMAGWLKDLVDLNILTVNQWYFTDIAEVKSNQPVVLIDSLNQTYQRDDCNGIYVFHPIYDYSESRCNWKADETTEWKKVDFIPKTTDYPVLVFSYYNKAEMKDGIPFDCIELTDPNQIDWILLPKNEPYEIVAIDHNRKIVPLNM